MMNVVNDGQLIEMFPSPSGDPLFKYTANAHGQVCKVSVPFRRSFIQIGKEWWNEYEDAEFPSPSGDPLFKFCFDPSKVLTGGGFRPLPGILYSNERRCSLCYLELVSVPFRGSFIQIGFKKL